MSKKREPLPEPEAPVWMATYADLMSLLLCFFVMLLAMSIIMPLRFEALADTIKQDFTGYAGMSRDKTRKSQTTPTVADSAARNRRVLPMTGGQPNPGPEGRSPVVHTILLDGETVAIIRFGLSNDDLTEQAQRELRAILPALQGSPQKIMIRGHVAPIEGGGAYRRDVDLAFSRAITVTDYLVSLGLREEFFEIVMEPTVVPRRTRLPAGMDPSHAGASVEILLLNQTLR